MFSLIGVAGAASAGTAQDEASEAAGFGGRWYKGDLHWHSTHSDGSSTVGEMISVAEELGLEFFVLTDHDAVDMGRTWRTSPSTWDDPEYKSDKMVLLYGVEWSTSLGHANVWSSEKFDYSALDSANQNRDADAAIRAAHGQNALFSINHPAVHLSWLYFEREQVDAIEVWSGQWPSG